MQATRIIYLKICVGRWNSGAKPIQERGNFVTFLLIPSCTPEGVISIDDDSTVHCDRVPHVPHAEERVTLQISADIVSARRPLALQAAARNGSGIFSETVKAIA